MGARSGGDAGYRIGGRGFRCLGSRMASAFTLVLETSTPHASVALVEPGGVVEQRAFHSDRNHNALLFGPLEELLGSGARGNIGLVIVGSGPGSYSGTRVGIAAAQGIAMASGCPVVAVPSVLAVPSALGGGRCFAVGDARRGSFWHAEMDGGAMKYEPELCGAEELAVVLTAAIASRTPVISFEDPSRFPGGADSIRVEYPDAAGLWRVWSATSDDGQAALAASPPQPIYLKPPHITPAKRPWWTPGQPA